MILYLITCSLISPPATPRGRAIFFLLIYGWKASKCMMPKTQLTLKEPALTDQKEPQWSKEFPACSQQTWLESLILLCVCSSVVCLTRDHLHLVKVPSGNSTSDQLEAQDIVHRCPNSVASNGQPTINEKTCR